MTPEQKTMTLETTKAPGIPLDTALVIHNAKHPESPLHDVTAAVDAASADRLLTLLLAREAGRPAVQDSLRELVEGVSVPSDRLKHLLFFASLRLSLKGKPRATERMKAIMQEGPLATPDTRADANQAGRVWRLLDHLVRVGCLRRGDVPGVPGGGDYQTTPAR